MGRFPFIVGFLISIIVGLSSIFKLGGRASFKEVFCLSLIKMFCIFLIVFIFGLILEAFIKWQFRKKKGFNFVLKEERP